MYTICEYLYRILSWNKDHPDDKAESLDVAKAKLIAEDPSKRNKELDDLERYFKGRYYTEVCEAYDGGNATLEEFTAKVQPLVDQYQADMEEYDKSKGEG